MITTMELTRDSARTLVQEAFTVLAREVDDGPTLHTSRPDLEILEQASLAQDRLNELTAAMEDQHYPSQAKLLADTMLASLGTTLSELPVARQADLVQGMTRALIEEQRLFLFRMSERLLPWVSNDPLFVETERTPAAASPLASAANCTLGPKVGEAVEAYLAYGAGRWTAKTLKSRERMLAYLVEHLGEKAHLANVSSHDVRRFRDGLKRLRRSHHSDAGRTFVARQTENSAKQIAPKTAQLIFEPTKAFFKWCKGVEGYISFDPAADVKIDLPKKPRAGKSRRPFTPDELKTLFSAPIFTGCSSPRRRFVPGAHVVKDAYFWIPILGYFTGCRLGELVQLHLRDVVLDGKIPYLLITDEGSGGAGSGTEKHVKSSAGVRKVPLHPHVIELGFLEFVEMRRKRKKPRLFFEIKFGADKQASTVFSKWFGRLLDKAGITDPALVYHSFRHGAEDAFRNALQPQYVIDRIIGHSSEAVSAQYGEGVSLDTAYDAVAKMKLPFDIREVVK